MQATVFYIELTEAQRDELNSHPDGWNSRIGRQYLSAKAGKLNAGNASLLRKVATIEASNAESVWLKLQNGYDGWVTRPDIECHTSFPRSMDVGDQIVWENGKVERCAPTGFDTLQEA